MGVSAKSKGKRSRFGLSWSILYCGEWSPPQHRKIMTNILETLTETARDAWESWTVRIVAAVFAVGSVPAAFIAHVAGGLS